MNCSKWKLFCLGLWVGYHECSVILCNLKIHLQSFKMYSFVTTLSFPSDHPCPFPRLRSSLWMWQTASVAWWHCFFMRFEMLWQEHLLVQCVPLHLWIVTHFLSDLFSPCTSSACTFWLHYLFAQMASCTQGSIRGSLPCFFFFFFF